MKPARHHIPRITNEKAEEILKSCGKFVTEEQLAEIFELNVNKAVIKAVELGFSRIRIKKTRYYSKKQILAYLSK
ncbi:MAG: hypothetical protein LHV68_11375 [Elusimicrobia bacterium]|nr:hypothetical protein [Candidatus Liberimonas magnetica]